MILGAKYVDLNFLHLFPNDLVDFKIIYVLKSPYSLG